MENQTQNQSMDDILKQYSGRNLFISRKERDRALYKDQWQGSTMAQRKIPDPIDLTFDNAKIMLWDIMKKELAKNNETFYITQSNKDALNHIIMSIMYDIDGPYNPDKGIYLYGLNSHGKTWIMMRLMDMIRNAYYSGKYSNVTGIPYVISYKQHIMLRAKKEGNIGFVDTLFKNKPMIFVDDLGYENGSDLVLYGQRENMVVELIDILYHHYLKGVKVFFTSNIMPNSHISTNNTIMSMYGHATHDRLIQMCTPVYWQGDKNLRTGK